MKLSATLLCCSIWLTIAGEAYAQTAELDIPYEEFYLDNGLRVIVHEDRKAPIVAVTLWYHVGSRNENPGKTGFAHLFEHLMFNGSENHDREYFEPLQQVGATSINGTTNTDRTNYFQTVPSSALDLALWLESDRMGHLLGVIDQEKLDEQRGVVQNEKRQRENQPYGKAFDYITGNVFPEGHPYSWTTIGSMEDLNAASLDDAYEWFRTYYGPNNATLVLAGDVDVETARDSAQRHFGTIPPGPPLSRMDAWVPTLEHDRRMIVEDRVRQARIYRTWPVPEWGSAELDRLYLANGVLTQGQTSRLYQRLVYEDQLATDAGGFLLQGEIAGTYVVWATAQPGQELAAVEAALDEELQRFLDTGPTEKELSRVITQTRSSFVRGVERVGGFSGKSGILAESAVFGGRPDAYKDSLALMDSAKTGGRAQCGAHLAHQGVVHTGNPSIQRPPGSRRRRCGPFRPADSTDVSKRRVSEARAHGTGQRDATDRGAAQRRPGGQLQPPAQRGLRGRPVCVAGHGRAGNVAPGSGNRDPRRA